MEDRLLFDTVLAKFTAYCNPRKNITITSHKFFTYKQQEGQPFNDYIMELKKRSSECEFGHAAEEMRIHAKELNSFQKNADVNKISRKHVTTSKKKIQSNTYDKQSKSSWDVIKRYKFCNSSHNHDQCPAYGKKCRSCKQLNHFQVYCPNKQVKAISEASSTSYSSDE